MNKAIEDSGVSLNTDLERLKIICRFQERSCMHRWRKFPLQHGHSDIPAQTVHIALYITHLLDIGASYSTVNSAIYAIKWMNKIRSHLDPTENSCVRSLPRILQNDNWEASGKKRSRRQ